MTTTAEFMPVRLDEEDHQLNVQLASIDNVWIRQMHFDKTGKKNNPHYHTHDHASLLAAGSVKVTIGDAVSVFKAPAMILVVKDKLHHMEALEDNTVVYCIHGLRESPYGELVSPEMIPAGLDAMQIAQKYGPFAIHKDHYASQN